MSSPQSLPDMQSELVEVRRRLAATAWGYPVTGGSRLFGLLAVGITLGAISVGSAMLGWIAATSTDVAVGVVFFATSITAGLPSVVMLRRAGGLQRPVNADRAVLLAREQDLVTHIAMHTPAIGEVGEAGEPVVGAPKLALAPHRQPSPYAQMMWSRFRIGPSPEVALRRLPQSAPGWKVWFYRHVGWALLSYSVFAVSVLTLYALRALR